MKNKWLAAVLNIVPGVGYLYAGVRTPFAVLLLAIWPLFFISGMTMTAEEYEATEAIPVRIEDFLPFLALMGAFVVDAFQEVKAQTQKAKLSK